jgi:hypothetical protein
MLHIFIVRLLMLKHWNFVMGKEAKGKAYEGKKKKGMVGKEDKKFVKEWNWKHRSWIKSLSSICCGQIQ